MGCAQAARPGPVAKATDRFCMFLNADSATCVSTYANAWPHNPGPGSREIGPGDSGGPVFRFSGSALEAVGTVSGFNTSGNGVSVVHGDQRHPRAVARKRVPARRPFAVGSHHLLGCPGGPGEIRRGAYIKRFADKPGQAGPRLFGQGGDHLTEGSVALACYAVKASSDAVAFRPGVWRVVGRCTARSSTITTRQLTSRPERFRFLRNRVRRLGCRHSRRGSAQRHNLSSALPAASDQNDRRS